MSAAIPASNGRSPGPGSDLASVLVTGAAGFIGSHLCERLLQEGHRVWGLDNFDDSYDPARKRENLRKAMDHPSMHLVEGDARDQVLLDGLMSDVNFDAVVHLAARPGVQASIENPELTFDVNLGSTLAVLETLRRHNVPVFLFASSSEQGSRAGDAAAPDGLKVADRPASPFSAAERAAELVAHTYHHLHGLTVHCLRLPAAFGPRQRPDLPVAQLARRMMEGEALPAVEPSDRRCRYVFVDDVVEGVLRSLDRALAQDGEEPEYRILDLEPAAGAELGDVMGALAEHLDFLPPNSGLRDESGGDPGTPTSNSTGRKAGAMFGWKPTTPISEATAECARWLREQKEDRPGTGMAPTSPSPDPGTRAGGSPGRQ